MPYKRAVPLGGSYVKGTIPNGRHQYNCRLGASLELWNKRRGMRTEPQQKDTDRSSLSALAGTMAATRRDLEDHLLKMRPKPILRVM